MNTLKVIIVDDEQEACDNIRNILALYPDLSINILDAANDTTTAEAQIKKLDPDAVFLDIDMPNENAFQFLERIYPYNFEIVFVTAYDEFAINAFKLNAVDYVLKPICIDDLLESVQKLRERIEYKLFAKNSEYQIGVLKQIAKKEPPQKITLKSLNHVEIVDFKDVCYIEGQGSYCKVCFNKAGRGKVIITSSIIAHYEEILPSRLFYRIHKSYLVNCIQIADIVTDDNYSIIMKNEDKLPISRRRFTDFINFLRENNFYSV